MRGGGAGTLLVLLIVLGIAFSVSIVAGIILLVILVGGFMLTNRPWICGNCGNRIDGQHITVCPSCNAELS